MSMKHYNDTPVTRIYNDSGFRDRKCQGAIIAFNVFDSQRQAVGFSTVRLCL